MIEQWKPDLVIVAFRWKVIPKDAERELFDFLEANANQVLLVESPPVLEGVGNRSFYQYASFIGFGSNPTTDGDHIWQQDEYEETEIARKRMINIAFDRRNFSYIPLADLYVRQSGIMTGSQRQVFYFDDDHLTEAGTALATSRFSEAIQQILMDNRNVFPLVSDRGAEANKTLQATSLPGSE